MRIEGDLSSHSLETPEHFLPFIELFIGANKVAKNIVYWLIFLNYNSANWKPDLFKLLSFGKPSGPRPFIPILQDTCMYDSKIWAFSDCFTEDTCRFLKSRLFQEKRMLISNYHPFPYIEDDLLKQDHQRWGYSTVTHLEQPVFLATWKDLNKKKRKEQWDRISL